MELILKTFYKGEILHFSSVKEKNTILKKPEKVTSAVKGEAVKYERENEGEWRGRLERDTD